MRAIPVVPGAPVREYAPPAAALAGGGNVIVWRVFVTGVVLVAIELGWWIGGVFS
jgi:hypothetical protein